MKKIIMALILSIGLFLCASPVLSADKTVRLFWTQQLPDPGGAVIAGWHVYRSESPGTHVKGTFWINVTWNSVAMTEYSVSQTITQPPVGGIDKTYYFVITAYSAGPVVTESDFSTEISLAIPPEAPKVPGKPTGLRGEVQ